MHKRLKKAEIVEVLSRNEVSHLLFSSPEEKLAWINVVVESSGFQPMLKEIKAEANRLLDTPIKELSFSLFNIYYETGSRIEYEKAYFEKRRRLNTFAILTMLEPDVSEYKEQLQNTIWSICNEYTWCLPAHFSADSIKNEKETIDLFAAETAFALSEILHLTKECLDPLIQQRISAEIKRRIIKPFLTQEPFFWESATHNWAAVCAGSIGAASLYLVNDHEQQAEILERVLAALEAYLTGFYDDGTCLEGYGYWEYGFGFYVYFADLLKKRTNGKIDLFQSEKVHQIALFQQKIFLHKNNVANFSDALPAMNINLGLSHYLSEIYPDFELPEIELRAPFTADHCSRWAPVFRQLYWFPSTI